MRVLANFISGLFHPLLMIRSEERRVGKEC